MHRPQTTLPVTWPSVMPPAAITSEVSAALSSHTTVTSVASRVSRQ
jgi:hypothetical protein